MRRVVGVIEKLDNNEQVLLMFLAGELPVEDRQEVAQLLEVDAALRGELDELQGAQQFVDGQLAQLDEWSPLSVSADFAARKIGREMRQRMARPKEAPAVADVERPIRSWRWLYPTVAAASIAMIAMVWLGRQAMPGKSPYLPVPSRVNTGLVADAQPADPNVSLLIQSLQPADEEPKQVAVADGMPQDDVSQYLLSATDSEK